MIICQKPWIGAPSRFRMKPHKSATRRHRDNQELHPSSCRNNLSDVAEHAGRIREGFECFRWKMFDIAILKAKQIDPEQIACGERCCNVVFSANEFDEVIHIVDRPSVRAAAPHAQLGR